jgi:hypothetical protein
MADYIITMDDLDGEYDVRFDSGIPQYNIGVNYEIPTKSNQYNNLLLDNISSSFNGSTQTFPLTVNGEPYFPLNDQQLIISINDVVLSPGVDYQVSGSNITFIPAPTTGQEFFGVALVTSADLTRTVNFVLDNGSFDITPGSKGYLNIDVTGTIESWTLVSDTVGNIVIDIRKTTYSNFPNGFTSIVGSEFPRLTNQDKNRDENLSTWNDQITSGDILDFTVASCTGIQKCSVFLRLKL